MADEGAREFAIFADHASWIAPQLPDPTRRGLVAWMSSQLSGGARDRLRAQMPLLHPLHEAAESALVGLLDRTLCKPRRRAAIQQRPDRNIDWSATYLRALGVQPHEFVSLERTPAPDLETTRALIGLATSWALALESFEDGTLDHRARRLRTACARAAVQAPAAFGTRHARALARLDRAAAAAVSTILSVLAFWDAGFGANGDRESLLDLAKTLRADDADNINILLEIVARLSVTRVATSTRAYAGGPPWRLAAGSWSRRNGIELRAGPWRCKISKGLLSNGAGQRLVDGVSHSLVAMGLHSVGSQPDIVIAFWHADAPEATVFCLGDAKRNVAGTGEEYLRESVAAAAAYAHSYARPLGLHVPATASACHGHINPMVTLFCARSVPAVVGVRGTAEAQAEAVRRAPRLPPFMAFDLANHFGPRESGEWSAPVLQAWFERISNEACRFLSATISAPPKLIVRQAPIALVGGG
jgi:hypothetical protein